jgi:hypothetical protein
MQELADPIDLGQIVSIAGNHPIHQICVCGGEEFQDGYGAQAATITR